MFVCLRCLVSAHRMETAGIAREKRKQTVDFQTHDTSQDSSITECKIYTKCEPWRFRHIYKEVKTAQSLFPMNSYLRIFTHVTIISYNKITTNLTTMNGTKKKLQILQQKTRNLTTKNYKYYNKKLRIFQQQNTNLATKNYKSYNN